MREFIVSNLVSLILLVGAMGAIFIPGVGLPICISLGILAWFAYRQGQEDRKKIVQLASESAFFQALFHGASQSILLFNDHTLINCNQAALKLFAVPSATLLASLGLGKFQPERQPDGSASDDALRRKLNEAIQLGQPLHFEWTFLSFEAREFLAEVTLDVFQANGENINCLAIRDISEKKTDERKVVLASQVFENSPDGIVITDAENKIVLVNSAFSTITGYACDEVIGRNPSVLSSSRHTPEFYTSMWESLKEQGKWQGEIWNIRKNGDIYPQWLNISRIANEKGQITHYLGVFSDISDRKNAESRVLHQVYHDQLTGLPNRVLFTDRLHQLFALAKRHPENHIAVIYIDVDRPDHDSMRGETGDHLLKMIARRLSNSLRETDTLARMNGDEFAILLSKVSAVDEATGIAQKMLRIFQDPFVLQGELVRVPLSIGIGVYPSDGTHWESLLQSATIAMQRAQKAGGACYELFNTDLGTHAKQRRAIESGLNQALGNHELELYYQPEFECLSGKLIGFEALLRWRHPEQGLILPETFLNIAEETGAIIPIGAWVLQTACAQAKAWRRQSPEHRFMAVNLSARQFQHPELVKQVISALNLSGLPANCLELEITESMIMQNVEASIAVMQVLADLGVEIALDDFGKGYSSFAYLKKMPIKSLKIDKSFIHGIMGNANGATTVDAIFAMAEALGLRVVIKGIEEQAQLANLRQHVQAFGQGYLLGHPVSAGKITELLDTQKLAEEDATRVQPQDQG